MTRLELLAPARTADIGIAAIRCGADAVYIGGPAFGARAAACNSLEDISRLCREAAPFGARIFVTVNTLARDDEERVRIVRSMEQMRGLGISAFILQDLTLMPLLRAAGPWKEEFHASTQCAIRTPERARFIASLGFTRLILERQLSLGQIRDIRAAIGDEVQLECFVHGALCVCYSGDCYLSEALTGRSANRGECSQPCRSLYDLCDSSGAVLVGNSPLLSLRDLCLIDRIGELAEAGVCSFKIEGRLKNEAYVKNVTRAYSIKLDQIIAARPDLWCRASAGHCTGGFVPDVNKTFNREYTTLFLDGHRGQWGSSDSAKGMGEFVGSSDHLLCELHNGDGLCYVRENGAAGVKCRREVVGFRVDKVEKGHDGRQTISVWSSDGAPDSGQRGKVTLPGPGVRLWRNLDVAFLKELDNNMPRRSIEVSVKLSFLRQDAASGEGWSIRLETDDAESAAAVGFALGECPEAENQDRMKALCFNQISKSTGIYDFILKELVCNGREASGGNSLPLVSAKTLNELRRRLAEKIADCGQRRQEGSVGTVPQATHRDALVHPVRQGELMRTKYCIRHRLGLCTKEGTKGRQPKGNLFLRNNGHSIPLVFDCANCEMVVALQGNLQK